MAKYWIALVLAVVISSVSQMFLKRGAQTQYGSVLREYLNPWVLTGYALLFISTLCIIFAYAGVDYKNGPVIESLGFIFVLLLGRLLFSEKLTRNKIIGMCFIMLGVLVFYS